MWNPRAPKRVWFKIWPNKKQYPRASVTWPDPTPELPPLWPLIMPTPPWKCRPHLCHQVDHLLMLLACVSLVVHSRIAINGTTVWGHFKVAFLSVTVPWASGDLRIVHFPCTPKPKPKLKPKRFLPAFQLIRKPRRPLSPWKINLERLFSHHISLIPEVFNALVIIIALTWWQFNIYLNL